MSAVVIVIFDKPTVGGPTVKASVIVILSASLDNDVFRFVANSTELVEVEGGVVRNESVNIALQAAIETAVLQTIKEGIEYKYWTVRR